MSKISTQIIFTSIASTLAMLVPIVAFASPTDFAELVDSFYNILAALVPLLVGFAIVCFLYGVQKYILAGASEDKIKEGREMMIYGIIGLVVIFSVWALVRIVLDTVGIQEGGTFDYSQSQGVEFNPAIPHF